MFSSAGSPHASPPTVSGIPPAPFGTVLETPPSAVACFTAFLGWRRRRNRRIHVEGGGATLGEDSLKKIERI
jgi:hypothetical protein